MNRAMISPLMAVYTCSCIGASDIEDAHFRCTDEHVAVKEARLNHDVTADVAVSAM